MRIDMMGRLGLEGQGIRLHYLAVLRYIPLRRRDSGERIIDIAMWILWYVEEIAVPRRQLDILHEPKGQVRLEQTPSAQLQLQTWRIFLTLLTNGRPNATSCPVSSATFIAVSLVYPPTVISGRGRQSSRMNSFD